jgi:hypothetical protein
LCAKVYVNLGDVLDILVLINNGINFILYCSMSKQFRDTFIGVFRLDSVCHSASSLQTSTSQRRTLNRPSPTVDGASRAPPPAPHNVVVTAVIYQLTESEVGNSTTAAGTSPSSRLPKRSSTVVRQDSIVGDDV